MHSIENLTTNSLIGEQYIKDCHQQSTRCAIDDTECSCKKLQSFFTKCLDDDHLKSNSTCAPDILTKRTYWYNNGLQGCIKMGYSVDVVSHANGIFATAFGSLAMAFGIFL